MTIPAAVGLLWVVVGLHGPPWVFAVSWPLYVLGIAGCVWQTRRRLGVQQSLKWEDHVILGSLLVHLLGVYLLSVGDQLLSVDGLGNLVALLADSVLGPIAVFATALTYFPNISRYAHDGAGLRGHVTGLYLIGIGSLVLVFSLHKSGGQWPIVRLFGLAAIGFGIFGELVDILHEDE